MKTNFIRVFLAPALFFILTSCNKESELPTQEVGDLTFVKAQSPGGCRMTSHNLSDAVSDFENSEIFLYNEDGLVSEVIAGYGWRFIMEYNAQKRLVASTAYEGDAAVNKIDFVYERNRMVEEVWRNPETLAIEDRYFYTYDQSGNLIRSESFMNSVYVLYTYSNSGNMLSNQAFIGGIPFFKADYTYENNIKNPYTSLNGIGYTFWYANVGFGRGLGQRWFTSETITNYDEAGNPIPYYALDPGQTTTQMGAQNFPFAVNYVDDVSGLPVVNSFTYGNCNPGQNARVPLHKKAYAKRSPGEIRRSILR